MDITGTEGPDTLDGTTGDDVIRGLGGDDVINGGDGNDQLYGGTGRDELHGGNGNDRLYIETANDVASGEIYDGGDGTDTLVTLINTDVRNVTLTSIEQLQGTFTLTSAQAASVSNFLVGNFIVYDTAPVTLTGSYGSLGAVGFIAYPSGGTIDASGLTGTGTLNLQGAGGNDTLTGSNGNDLIQGYGGDDVLYGGGGSDTMVGGAGRDELHGGAGFDTFRVELADLAPGEVYDGGADTDFFQLVNAAGRTFDLTGITLTSVEALRGENSGIAQVRLTLDQLDQFTSFGGSLNLVLTTGGTVSLAGVSTQSTVTFQLSDQATTFDTTGISGTILTITGGSGNDTIVGPSVNNIYGGAGDDILSGGFTMDGGTGADRMYGSVLSQTYYADQQNDLIFESANGGYDTVNASASFYLYDNIEQLNLTGTADLYGVGNALDNTINGNGGGNLLVGGAGNDIVHGNAGVDTLYGEDGNDQLFGDADNDVLIGGNGNDIMDGGTGGDSLYGEAGNDVLYGGTDFVFDRLVGGDGNDILHGDSGQGDYDDLYGNAGDDLYFVDTGDDRTFEQPGEGTDTVYANVAGANNGVYLYANIENLVLLNTTKFGVGNELANVIIGNDVGNLLLGGDGNDTLNGGRGNDVLFGQGGADTFVFQHGTGGDVVGDFVPGTDRIDLTAIGYTWQQVQNSYHQNGNDLAIDLGGGDFIILQGVNQSQLHQSDFILAGSSSAASLHADAAAAPAVHDPLPDMGGDVIAALAPPGGAMSVATWA